MPTMKCDYLSEVWKDDNKVVFCTGGAGTICSAQVRALVHLGANACIIGRNVEKTEAVAKDIATARLNAKVLGIGAVDVRSLDSLQAAVDRCVKELGSVDFVIAGAAGNFLAPITQLSANGFKSVIDIDVQGSYNTIKATLPHLIRSAAKYKTDGKTTPKTGTGGRIIFISATIHYTGLPLQAHVSAAKAGIDALSAAMAIELGPRGLTSNVIAPGAITETEGMQRLIRKEDVTAVEKEIPSGRYGRAKEIADATVFLFSDAGNYINGDILVGELNPSRVRNVSIADKFLVDGGGWHRQGVVSGVGLVYPNFLLADEVVTGVQGTRKAKL
ncbi:hypothetical protein FGG08_001265 [Glutinoglossum americanum]|uniref:2,4-dienoyl-CoA reductase [(3E)-enoyl-CoA-producing] n=1 Tax=Glutinoglossum americanum TaxID=1670608 RepID=A0A9P8IBF8_9PEZI|nr:hypothetical protein FGG08_001265 [Glutinoglossum americanum]